MTTFWENKSRGTGSCHWLIWLASLGLFSAAGNLSFVHAGDLPADPAFPVLTNINQFRETFGENADRKHPFRLDGVVTMADTNRNLFVLQDDSGAMAFAPSEGAISVHPGQLISLAGDEAAPYFEAFPDYPYQPSGSDIRSLFEAPANWGDYHLTRMRGYLHPPSTGDYVFWIASDNSSELWLSSDVEPAQARRIASIKSGDWVGQHDWTHYPSQRSEIIHLSADKTYYIEAVSEQLSLNENLAVAWQPPGLGQSVIDGHYLTPWIEKQPSTSLALTNGVLREYWTNYTLGSVMGIIGSKPFTSIFATKAARTSVLGSGSWPEPLPTPLDQPLLRENNYRWAKVNGTITFVGVNGASAVLELADKGRRVEVRIANWDTNSPLHFQNRQVQIEGVCQGMQTANGYLMPGLIWAAGQENISFIETTNAIQNSERTTTAPHLREELSDPNYVWSSYISVRGVVTFSDQVFGKDFLFIQDDATGINILQATHHFNQLQVGQWVEVGGTLRPGGYSPDLVPVQVTILGSRPMPRPETKPVEIPVAGSRNGQWTELEGVIHSITPNGTLLLAGKKGKVSVWLGQTSLAELEHYVDSTLRVRGVLSAIKENDPLLLVPSRNFVEVEDKAPDDPFGIAPCHTSEINTATLAAKWIHRVKVAGMVIYRNRQLLFVQDSQGGLKVELSSDSPAQIGDTVEMIGFPEADNLTQTLTEALVHVVGSNTTASPLAMDLDPNHPAGCSDRLVNFAAKILTQKIKGTDQVLELQAGQHFYQAVLPISFGQLPAFEPGSRLKITGVFNGTAAPGGKITDGNDLSEPVEILLRNPQDVLLLQGAPWWTLKGFILLASILLTVVAVGLLVIYTLRRRLERQRLAKLMFSRQILQSQEEERRRIAVNLHDTLGQNLLIIKNQSHLAMQSPAEEPSIRHRLHQISEVTIQAIEEVRQITRNLRPYQLDRLGLTHAIRATIKQVSENSSILFASSVDEIDGTFDKESEIHVYRIVQECINNIIKHSSATEATIVIKKQAAVVSLSIRDNGQGFNVTANKPSGFGLNNIIERVWILGGDSKVDSAPGSGTNLIFEIPISPLK